MESIIFDFNGTMVFDQKLQEKAWRTYLNKLINRPVTDEEFQNHVHGVNAKDTLEYFLHKKLTTDEVSRLEEDKEDIYRDLAKRDPDYVLVDGLEEFLDHLKRREISFTIATASNLGNVNFYFSQLPLDRWFDRNLIVYNNGTIPGKPEPDIFLRSARKLGADIKNCIVFEDSLSGIKAAKRAGAGKIVGLTSMLSDHDLIKNGATLTIENFNDPRIWDLI